jgi:hypothetical protein
VQPGRVAPGPRLIGGAAEVCRDHRIDVSDEINAASGASDTPLDDLANFHRTRRIAGLSELKTGWEPW